MNKKKLIYQLLEKKFVFLFAITSILIFFFTLNIKNLNSTFTIRILPVSDAIYKTQIVFSKSMPKSGNFNWLNEKYLLDEFLFQFFQDNSHLKFRIKVKKDYFSSTTFLIFDRNQQFDYQVLALLDNFNDTFIENIQTKFNYALESHEETILIESLINFQIYSNVIINEENKRDIIKKLQLVTKERFNEHFLLLKKNKIFKFELTADHEKKFNKELIAIIISIFGAFLINITILIFIKYKKYI
jgi:hypothetical protein